MAGPLQRKASSLLLSFSLTHFDLQSSLWDTENLQSLLTWALDLWSSEVETGTPFTPEALKIISRDGSDFNLIHGIRL